MMSYYLKNRSLASLDELSARDIDFLLEMAHALKRAKNAGAEQPQLRGKNIALLFDQAATRTRRALEVAANDQGANVAFIAPPASQPGERQSLKDTARVLGRLYDAIEVRGLDPAIASELAQFAGVPVYSGLTSPFHPTQILADYMTMQEHCPDKRLSQMRLAYLGDARDDIGDALLQGAALVGLDLRIGAPRSLWPAQALIDASVQKAQSSGATLRFVESADEAVREVDFIYADRRVATGAPFALLAERRAQPDADRLDARLIAASGNPAVKFLHCLPARSERSMRPGPAAFVAADIDGLEVNDEGSASPASVVRDQAANRLHTIKALLVASLA
jgi:ornithine carbamoyltransferase